ncbi:MAG: glycosyltransferase family 4 protein [Pikeienuella sp.]
MAQKGHSALTVLQIVPRLNTGGVERGTLEMVEAVVAAGGRALVASGGGQLASRILRAGGEVFEMNLATKNPFNIWQNAGLLARLVREEAVDLVHARSRAPAWSAYWATRRTGTPFVTTYHGVYNEDLPLKRRYNSVMAKGRPVIAVSDFVAALIAERHEVPDAWIRVIPRGADITVFSEEAVSAQRTVALAERWGILDDPRPVVMLAGRLSRWKGHEGLIDAAAILRARRGADFIILIVGDGGEPAYLRALDSRIRGHGLEQQVWLTGGCSDMAAAYKLASVVVSASTEPEAFGRVVVEAQAMGRPVIATDHGGARETVRHGETGWLYPPGDVAQLAETLDAVLNRDPSDRAHMGLAARAHVHARYTIAAMQRATISVYEEAAGRTFGMSL